MRRYANRKDANHADIASALRAIGVGVIDAAQYGFPCDLIGVRAGVVEFLEAKDGSKPPSARRLTEASNKFAADLSLCGKRLHVVTSPAEALAVFGARVAA